MFSVVKDNLTWGLPTSKLKNKKEIEDQTGWASD